MKKIKQKNKQKKRILLSIITILIISTFVFSGCSLLENKNSNTHTDENILQDKDLIDDKEAGLNEDKDEDTQPEPEPEPEPEPPKGTTSIQISAVGDIMAHTPQMRAAKQSDGSYDFTAVFEKVSPYLKQADIALANLETTINKDGSEPTGYPCFKSPKELVEGLKKAGFNVITTANNHSLDNKEFGVINTLDTLDENDLAHTGTFRSKEDRDNSALIIEKNDIKLGVLAYTYGTNGMEQAISDKSKLDYLVNYLSNDNYQNIEEDIERLRSNGAEVIAACVHWGNEYQRQPSEHQIAWADKLINSGVDIIFGSHPHVIQPMEKKTVTLDDGSEKQVFVIYSMGNFVSNQRDRYKDSGIIVNIEIIKDYDNNTINIGEVGYIPTWVYKYQSNSKLNYEILPVNKYLDGGLSGNAQTRIKQVWEETTNHIGTEVFNVIQ